jgi:hypothetical protein
LLSKEKNETIASPFSPEIREIGTDEDPYDSEGHIKKGICVRPAIEQFPEPLIGLWEVRFSAPKMRSTSDIKPCFLLYAKDVDENVFSKTFLFSCQHTS